MKLAANVKTVTIEGDNWSFFLTPDEFAAWEIYAANHEYLLNWSYEFTLKMFLANFRVNVNLNVPVC